MSDENLHGITVNTENESRPLLRTTNTSLCTPANVKKATLKFAELSTVIGLSMIGAAFYGALACTNANKIPFPGFSHFTSKCPEHVSFSDMFQFYNPFSLSVFTREGISIFSGVWINAFISMTCIYKAAEHLLGHDQPTKREPTFADHHKKIVIFLAAAASIAHIVLSAVTKYDSEEAKWTSIIFTALSYWVQNYLGIKYLFDSLGKHSKCKWGLHALIQLANTASITGYLVAPVKEIAVDYMSHKSDSQESGAVIVGILIAVFTDIPFAALAARFCFDLVNQLHLFYTERRGVWSDHEKLHWANKKLIPLSILGLAILNWFSTGSTMGLNETYCPPSNNAFCWLVSSGFGIACAQSTTWMFNFYGSALLVVEWAYPSLKPVEKLEYHCIEDTESLHGAANDSIDVLVNEESKEHVDPSPYHVGM